MRLEGLSLTHRSAYLFCFCPPLGEMRARLEERPAGRPRIAQDLYDAVLQDLLSASMQLHVAVNQLPAHSFAKLRLSRVLELIGRLMEVGRNALRGLRSPNTDSDDLEQAFSRIPQELGVEEQIDFRVIVLGSARQLQAVIRDDVYRIGREALANAFRHSQASRIELELEYAARRFRIVVRDNGCGIDPQMPQSERDGHWGLPGMRELAESVGARLKVWSRAEVGTELELSVPNHIAFESRNR